MSLWPKRLLMTGDTVGGVWTFALDLARSFAARGMEVTLATCGGPLSRDQRELVKTTGNIEVLESNFRLEWQDDPWTDVDRATSWLFDIADRTHPDLLHLNEYSHASAGWNLPVVVSAHSCVYSWYRAVRKSAPPSQWMEYHRRVTAGLHCADTVVVPSRALLEALEEHYGELPSATVVRNGRSGQNLYRTSKEPFILAAGRLWDEGKNIAALTRIASQVPWPVFVAGDPGRAMLPNVRWLGKLDPANLAWWMARASIYCLPAKYEPFGLSILEAALSGCALVLGDIDSLREIWGGVAQFADPDDAPQLAAVLMNLIQDPDSRLRNAEEAYRRALQYSVEKMAEGYLRAYSTARYAGHMSRRGAALTA